MTNAPYIIYPREILENTLHSFQAFIKKSENLAEGQGRACSLDDKGLLRDAQFTEVERLLQKSSNGGYVAKVLNTVPHSEKVSDIIDVVVPVYEGEEETLACINSVLEASNDSLSELIIVIDGSPNEKLKQKIKVLNKDVKFTLIENPTNLGFTRTVNHGMALHPERDVVLLNADTVVFDHWLDRMKRTAYSDITIGTVTPFSNNAEIFSYPLPSKENTTINGYDWQEIDQLARQTNADKVVDIPTAVGFCMFIKRECLKEVGYFDAEAFERGYGEENDFSRRAYKQGWRNVLAVDTFVYHKGGASFGAEKQALIANNLVTLNTKHPGYNHIVSQFAMRDPVHPYRRALDVARIANTFNHTFLYICPGFAKGGTNRHIDELVEKFSEEGVSVIVLFYRKDGSVVLKHNLIEDAGSLMYDRDEISNIFVKDLTSLNIWHIHYHHIINLSNVLLHLPQKLGISYDFTVHDYFTICPRINLIDDSGGYCFEPDESACNKCIENNGPHEFVDTSHYADIRSIETFRNTHNDFLVNARRVFVPSHDTKERIEHYFPLQNVLVREHFHSEQYTNLSRPASHDGLLRVAIIGAIGQHKGSYVIAQCAKHALKHNLPIEYIIVGFTDIDDELREYSNVEILGEYEEHEIVQYLKEANCDIAFFPSVWPETFSYTLSIAFQNSLFPVAYDLGAFSERIKKAGFGMLLNIYSTPGEINTALLKAGEEKHAPEPMKTEYANILRDYYGLKDITKQVLAA